MKLKIIFKKIKEYLDGDFAYQNYLEHFKNHHEGHPLSKKTFLKNKEKEKWSKINRCC